MRSNKLARGLIISCQPYSGDEPFYDYEFIKRFVMAAEFGGAVAVRIEGSSNIRRLITDGISIPIIGLIKKFKYVQNTDRISITPTISEVAELYKSGTRIIAADFTSRERRNKNYYRLFLREVKNRFKDVTIFADISTIDEAIIAQDLGVDYISSSLTGYTSKTKNFLIPNFDILKKMKQNITIPYFAEGGYTEIGDLATAISLGVHGIVIGTAITRPHIVTKIFNNKMEELFNEKDKD